MRLNFEPDILLGIWMTGVTGWAMERKESVEGKKKEKKKDECEGRWR